MGPSAVLGAAGGERARLAGQPSLDRDNWDRRSLHAFGEAPLEAVLADYDLVVYDHPFVGEIARRRR